MILYRMERPKSVIILIKNENTLFFFFNNGPPVKTMENHCCHPQTKNLNLDRIWSYGVFSLGHRYNVHLVIYMITTDGSVCRQHLKLSKFNPAMSSNSIFLLPMHTCCLLTPGICIHITFIS